MKTYQMHKSHTKIFGFIGFLPLIVKLIKKDRKMLLPFCLLIPISLGLILYIPVLISGGVSGFFDIVSQRFLKGNTGLGLGSDVSTTVGYQGILGTDYTKLLYPYSLLLLMGIVAGSYILRVRGNKYENLTEAIRFLGLSFIVFYLTGLRVFLQHYLWVIPILILYGVYSRKNGLISASVLLSFIIAFLGPPSIATYGYFLFGAPYNIVNVINVSDAQIVATSISFLLVLAFLQIVKPYTRPISVRNEFREFAVMGIQFLLIFGFLYAFYHSIINVPYFVILIASSLIILISPTGLSCIRSFIHKLDVIR